MDEAKRTRMLLVASDAQFAADLHQLLERDRVEVRVHQSAEQALAALGEAGERFDAVILDSSVPSPDLLRIYEHLRSQEAAVETPVVFSRSAFAPAKGQDDGDVYLAPTVSSVQVAQRASGLMAGTVSTGEPDSATDEPAPSTQAATAPPAAPRRGGARTALIGVLLGIFLGIIILIAILFGGLAVSLPYVYRLVVGAIDGRLRIHDEWSGWSPELFAEVVESWIPS